MLWFALAICPTFALATGDLLWSATGFATVWIWILTDWHKRRKGKH